MSDLSSIVPFLPFLGVLFSLIAPWVLMRLQGKKLKKEIELLTQNISNAKTTETKDTVTSLEILERITSTTAEEMEKALEKSITLKNLKEQVDLQKSQLTNQQEVIDLQTTKISSLVRDLSTEHTARLEVEEKMVSLKTDLDTERQERQKALAEIEHVKTSSDKIIQKWIARVKVLEAFIKSKNFQIPDCPDDSEEV